jgi:LIVCS family branched-chain amino acid:cation transporter
LLLVAVGILAPQSDFSNTGLTSVESFSLGFTEGYQTLDVLASVIFAGIIITAAQAKGYRDVRTKSDVVIFAGALSAVCLLIIYGGLLYLGATAGIDDLEIGRSALLIHIAKNNLGNYGMVAIALSIALACLTTAIALTSAVGTFFSRLTGGKLGYKTLVTLCCLVSGVLAVSGVDNIIQFAYPPLAFVYPIVITLVLYIVLFGSIVPSKTPYIGALVASAIVATLTLLKVLGVWGEEFLQVLSRIPFFDIDLGWFVPSIIGFVIGLIIDRSKK